MFQSEAAHCFIGILLEVESCLIWSKYNATNHEI